MPSQAAIVSTFNCVFQSAAFKVFLKFRLQQTILWIALFSMISFLFSAGCEI